MLNVFEHKPTGQLVSIVNGSTPEVKVLTANGELKTVKRGELVSAKLVSDGVYSERFIQAALEGVTYSPRYVNRDLKAYGNGKTTIFATPYGEDKVQVKYAQGIPSESAGGGADALNMSKRNIGTLPKFDAPAGPIDLMGESNEQVTKLVVEWHNPPDMSRDDIMDILNGIEFLGEPTIVKIVTPDGTDTKRKNTATGSVQASHGIKKQGYYGPSPVAYRTCPDCRSIAILEQDRKTGYTYNKCTVCKWSAFYEGSALNGGVAGQSKPE
jgi:hypothetical protein